MPVAHADDVLLDDGSLIQVCGDVVAGGTDDLHAAGVSAVVGAGPGEGGQEAVVDIYDALRQGCGEFIAQYLHVAGQHHGGDAVLCEERALAFLCGLLRGGGHRHEVKGNAESLCRRAQGVVVGEDEGDLCIQLPGLVAAEQVVETVGVLADKQRDAFLHVREVQLPRHAPGLGQGADEYREVSAGDDEVRQVPLCTHEEGAFLGIGVLIKLHDVAAILGDEGGDGAHEPGLVRAVDEEDGVRHFSR